MKDPIELCFVKQLWVLGPYWFLRYKVKNELVAQIELTNFIATSSLVLILVPIDRQELRWEGSIVP